MEVIHRIQTDTDGNVHVLFVRDIGVECRSDGDHRFHRMRTDSNGKVLVLFVRDLVKFQSYWILV